MNRKLSNVYLTDEKQTVQRMSMQQANQGKRKWTVRERIISVVAVLFVVGLLWPYFNATSQTATYQQQLDRAKAENKQAVVKQREVVQDYQRVQDPDYLAGVARRDYYYSKPGEIVFILKDEPKEHQQSGSEEQDEASNQEQE